VGCDGGCEGEGEGGRGEVKAWKEKYPKRAPTITRNPRKPRVSRFQLTDPT
jgi:hypothetical protein